MTGTAANYIRYGSGEHLKRKHYLGGEGGAVPGVASISNSGSRDRLKGSGSETRASLLLASKGALFLGMVALPPLNIFI